MSTLNRGFNQTALNGSIGAVTYTTRKGITIARQKVPAKSNARRTLSVMANRVRWMNVVRTWQALNGVIWRPSFTNKTGLQTDFNAFMQHNLNFNKVYLTKAEVAAGAGLVAAYTITMGSLPSIGGVVESGFFKSTIAMGGFSIGASTTVATLTNAILQNNPAWSDHDQLTIVVLKQVEGASDGIPRIQPTIEQLYLDLADESTLLGDLLPANLLSVQDGRLSIEAVGNVGLAFVHSSGSGADYAVSTENLTINNTLLPQYQTDEKMLEAIYSYGDIAKPDFLVPDYSDNHAIAGA